MRSDEPRQRQVNIRVPKTCLQDFWNPYVYLYPDAANAASGIVFCEHYLWRKYNVYGCLDLFLERVDLSPRKVKKGPKSQAEMRKRSKFGPFSRKSGLKSKKSEKRSKQPSQNEKRKQVWTFLRKEWTKVQEKRKKVQTAKPK